MDELLCCRATWGQGTDIGITVLEDSVLRDWFMKILGQQVNRVETWEEARAMQALWVGVWKVLHPLSEINPKEE